MWSNAFQISLFYWGKRIKNEFKLYPILKKKKQINKVAYRFTWYKLRNQLFARY